jgi:hypothetical protein
MSVNSLTIDPCSLIRLERIAERFCKLPPRFLFEYFVVISNPVGLVTMLDVADDYAADWPPDTIRTIGADRFPRRLVVVPPQ